MDNLVKNVLSGDHRAARERASALLRQGVPPQRIVVDGLTAAMLQLDSKCSLEDFDLLQIMLAGRCVQQVMELLYGTDGQAHSWSKCVAVAGTIYGDVHDLGKNIVRSVFTGAGYQIVDLGAGVAPERFAEAAVASQADFILVSSLLTTTLKHISRIREALPDRSDVIVVAGGAAVEQTNAADLNVDYAAANVFDGLHFCDDKVGVTP